MPSGWIRIDFDVSKRFGEIAFGFIRSPFGLSTLKCRTRFRLRHSAAKQQIVGRLDKRVFFMRSWSVRLVVATVKYFVFPPATVLVTKYGGKILADIHFQGTGDNMGPTIKPPSPHCNLDCPNFLKFRRNWQIFIYFLIFSLLLLPLPDAHFIHFGYPFRKKK